MQNTPHTYPPKWLITKDQAKENAAVDNQVREKIRKVLAEQRIKAAAPSSA